MTVIRAAEVNPLDAFDDLPADERKRVTETVRKLWDDNRAMFTEMQPVVGKVGRAGSDHPLLVEANRKLAPRGIRIKRYAKGYGPLRYVEYPDGYDRIKKELWGKHNIQPNLSNQGAGRTGDAFGTPVSDGKRVYVNTIHGTVAAFEMATGRLLWSRSIGGGQYREANHYMTSPRLYKDMVIACFGDTNAGREDVVLAVDRKTGKELWRHKVKGVRMARFPDGPGGSRPGSSPLVMNIDGQDVCILGTGQVLRLPDGKMYQTKLNNTLVPFAVDETNDAVFAGTSQDGPTCRYRLDLSIVDGELKAETAWVVGKNQRSYNVVFHKGMLYWGGYRIDPETGYPPGVKAPENQKRPPPALRFLRPKARRPGYATVYAHRQRARLRPARGEGRQEARSDEGGQARGLQAGWQEGRREHSAAGASQRASSPPGIRRELLLLLPDEHRNRLSVLCRQPVPVLHRQRRRLTPPRCRRLRSTGCGVAGGIRWASSPGACGRPG